MSGRAEKPGRRRLYVAVVCAVLLVAGVAGAVLALRGDGGQPASRSAPAPLPTGPLPTVGATASPPAAPTPTRDRGTPDPEGVLSFGAAPPSTYYLPRSIDSDDPEATPAYTFSLRASAASGPRGRGAVKDVTVSFDLSAFQGRADIVWRDADRDCDRSGYRVTCDLRTIGYGDGAYFDRPFLVRPKAGLSLGPAGTLTVTARGANAPTLRHTTRVVVGRPYLVARPGTEAEQVRPGSEVSLTAAFANQGDTGLDSGVTLAVSTEKTSEADEQSFLRTRYSNCRYDKAVGATKALCDFPGPVRAGAAFEADGPFTAVVGPRARQGALVYRVWRAGDVAGYDLLPGTAVRGTGAPLEWKPLKGDAEFVDGGTPKGEYASGSLRFLTTLVHDAEARGFVIRGKVGQVLTFVVPQPRNAPADDAQRVTASLTLPEGVSFVPFGPEGPGMVSEYSPCEPASGDEDTIRCSSLSYGGAVLRVRIDKRVDDARGSVRVQSRPEDPDKANDIAPILVAYVP